MTSWPNRLLLDLFGITVPILQAPMAGASTPQMAVAVSEAGGLGALACAQLSLEQAREALEFIRMETARPLNLNFFCHTPPARDPEREAAWRAKLAPYYKELEIDPQTPFPTSSRRPFDSNYCALVETYRPEVVSFHFGLPEPMLLSRVKATGAKILSSATTIREARWLEAQGVDAIIAMGWEAGGHRGNFLSDTMERQVGTFALVPQMVDAVHIPVIAAGGIADARGIVAALALGASAVQMGTAYLFCPEASLSPVYQQALQTAGDEDTAITNVFTGRPARGIANRLMREIGPLSPAAPDFPLAGDAIAPLRARSLAANLPDFVNLWAGQAVALGRALPASELTKVLASEALAQLMSGKAAGGQEK
jgi:nitronate monooxygenase